MRLNLAQRAPAHAQAKEGRGTGGILRLVLTVCVLAWAIRSFLFAPFHIPSVSMQPALLVGDYVLVAKWPYGFSRYSFPFGFPDFDGRLLAGSPERGDIVVFRPEGSDVDVIKRVIGLPGDRLEMRGGMLILNGRSLPRRAEGSAAIPITANSPCRVVPPASPQVSPDGRSCLYPVYRETLPDGRALQVLDQVEAPADDFGAVTVPERHVFLMGDNRDDSLDSRYPRADGGIGFVPLDRLIGRAQIIFWSTDGSAEYWKPWTWFTALRTDRLGKAFGGSAH